MKKVLVIVFSNLRHDARVNRQVQWLKKNHRVTVVCFDMEDTNGVRVVRLRQTTLSSARKALLAAALLLKRYALAYRIFHDYADQLAALRSEEYELIVANDIDTLPLAFQLNGRKVLFDAHEYAPRHFENRKRWRLFFQPFYISLCRKYIPLVGAMLTVGEGLAKEYAKHFGVEPIIITNATNYHDISPSPVDSGRVRLIHHGIINESRRLELMIDMMEHLDERFTLDLILMSPPYASAKTKKYIEALRARVEKTPRMQWLPAVRSDHVVRAIAGYDIGVFLIPPVNFNYANTLPNKLFDYIQARLGIAIGPTPEMASIVKRFGNGVVSADFHPVSLAHALNKVTTDDVIQFKERSASAARELNAERNEEIFNRVVAKLLNE